MKQLRCWVEINLANLERNLKRIRQGLPSHVQYIAVVKADAYGHGLFPTTTRLMHCGADMFAVANAAEAREIREFGSGWPILILSAMLPGEEKAVIEHKLIPSLSSINEIERFNQAAEKANTIIPVHLKVDTGMGRLGIWHENAESLFYATLKASHLKLQGIFTHYSSADCDAAFTQLQRDRFMDVIRRLGKDFPKDIIIHADNSAGIETFPVNGPMNAVRVGLMQFGIRPYKYSVLSSVKIDPVFSFYTRIGLIKELPEGTPISYGQTHHLKKKTRIAILTAGYGDGIPTSLSNRGFVLIRGIRCPVIGRVTMDQTIIDISKLPNAEIGEIVTLVGEDVSGQHISLEEFSEWANHIPWEILVSVTKRVERIYRLDTAL